MTVPEAEKGDRERYIVYLSTVKAPPTGPARFWKDQMRVFNIKAVEEALPNSEPVIKGISWHYSQPWERGIDMETNKNVTPAAVLTPVLEALKRSRQDWEIKGMIATDFVDLIIPDLDGGARGDRASQRAEDIVKAKKWKLANSVATWLGQHNNREHYEGKHTGLQLTIISKTIPSEGVDRKY